MTIANKNAARAHVLVVENNQELRDALVGVLEFSGIRVSLAETGEKALEMVRGQAFDLVLLDIDRPETVGPEIPSRLAKDYPQAKIMLISECPAFPETKVGLLRKPFHIMDLWQLVEDILDQGRAGSDFS